MSCEDLRPVSANMPHYLQAGFYRLDVVNTGLNGSTHLMPHCPNPAIAELSWKNHLEAVAWQCAPEEARK